MQKLNVFIYGVISYLIFFITFLYAIGFVGNIFVSKGIDTGEPGNLTTSVIVNIGLLGLFAVQHSIMARQKFKKWLTSFIPIAAERSTYVLFSSLILALLIWQWKPMPDFVWHIEAQPVRLILWCVFWLGWLTVLVSTFLVNHFDLFGLRQVLLHLTGKEYHHLEFSTPGLYRYVRHPIMSGFLVAFWATPDMTVGHFLFSVATTGYILVGVFFEEKDLQNFYGEKYTQYQQEVPKLMPIPKAKPPQAPGSK
ncbi:MAG: NnrU family protein [Methylococcaceae bacterium]|nr:NnrU family protein [Methylococcaceae bacterium]